MYLKVGVVRCALDLSGLTATEATTTEAAAFLCRITFTIQNMLASIIRSLMVNFIQWKHMQYPDLEIPSGHKHTIFWQYLTQHHSIDRKGSMEAVSVMTVEYRV